MDGSEKGREQRQEDAPLASHGDDWKVFSVRIRSSELAELDALCAELDVKRNRAVRSLILKACGFVEYDKDTTQALKSLTRQLSGLATNINQIARLGNTTGKPDYDGFVKSGKDVVKAMMALEAQVQILLNLKKRRSDAFSMMRKAVRDG